jgi:hypothetical protein
MTKRILFAIASAVAFLVSFSTAQAQRGPDAWRPDNRGDWDLLGSAQIGTRVERDVIDVGRREGRFSSIGFTVTGSDVRIEDLRIVYGSGESEQLQIREFYKDGTRSRPIDLQGRGNFIQRIEVAYRAPGPVKIDFYGERRRPEARWDQLGCQRVGFLETRDVIRVGRREGAFKALKLQVSDAPLRLNKMRVVFGNGPPQTLDVRSIIPPGTQTRPLDLDGSRRTIDRIELEYIPSIALKKGANVCVLATEGSGPGRGGPDPGVGRGGGTGPASWPDRNRR